MKNYGRYSIVGMLLIVGFAYCIPLHAQSLESFHLITSEGDISVNDFHIEASSGNMHMIGNMDDDITFRRWGANFTLFDDPDKLDFYYAASTNNSSIAHIYRISVDPARNNSNFINKLAVTDDFVFILGSFAGTLSVFDENNNILADRFGSTVFSSTLNDTDAFLFKFEKSTGNLNRVYTIGGDGRDFGDYMTVDNNDNIVVSGRFNGTVDFQINKTGAFGFPFRAAFEVTSDGNDLFVVKYDASNFENLLLFQNIGGPDEQNKTLGITVNKANELFITGRFHRQVTIDSESQETSRSDQVFVTKLNSNFSPAWLKLLEDDSDANTQVTSMGIEESSQQLFVVGRIQGNATYDNNTLNNPTTEDNNLLILKLNSQNGNLEKDKHIYGGTGYQDGKQIVFDAIGNYYLTGTFYDNIDITTNGQTKSLSNENSDNTFLAAFNKNDHIVYIKGFVNSERVFSSKEMFLFSSGNFLDLYAVLNYSSNVNVDLEGSQIITSNSGIDNAFIGKYQFNKIPIFTGGSLFTDDGSFDIFYWYEASATFETNLNLGTYIARFIDDDGTPTTNIEPFADGETLTISVPESIVAGVPYRLQLDFEEYKDIHPFNTFTVPPDVHPFEATVTAVAGDNLNIPGRYFGNQTSGVSVNLVKEENGNEVPAQVNSVAPTAISINIPQAYAGSYKVRVSVNGETTDGDNLTILPQISEITPINNTPGGNMTISGNTFIDGSHGEDQLEVRLIKEDNTIKAITITDFITVDAEEITLKLPEDLADGSYQVELETDGFISNQQTITIENTDPVVSALQPTSGLVGDEITISGINLAASTVKVTINGIEASLVSASDTQVKAIVPALEPGSYEVILWLDEVDYALTDTFTVLSPPTVINPLNVTSGVSGGEIVITGLNLNAETVEVTINGVNAPVVSANATQIKATIPELEAGTYQVLLYLDGEEYLITDSFKIIFNKPIITEVDQDSADVGTVVTVSGLNLNLATSVTLGSTETSFETVDNTSLKLTVPDLFPGSYPINISDNSGEDPATYESLIIAHNVSSLSPSQVFGSSEITISGSNFRSLSSPPAIEVLLNDVAVDNITVNEAGTAISFMLAVNPDNINEEYVVKVSVNGIIVTADESILVKADETAAVVVPTFPSNALRKNEFNVSVEASDAESDIQKVEAAFAGIMDEAFGPFQEITNNESLYTLLTGNGDELGVKYQFKVINGAGLEKIERGRTYWSYAENIEKVNRKSFASAPTQQNYQLVAIPFKQQTVNAALGNKQYKKEDWRLFRLNLPANSENPYQEFNAGFSQFKPGEGYWLIAKNGVLDSIKGDVAEPNEEGNIIIPVSAGWNLIGNPYPFDIDWGEVVSANADIFSDQARLSVYNGSYSKVEDKLLAYEGAFVNIINDGSLIVPFSAKTNGSQRQKTQEKDIIASLDADQWQINLSVHISDSLTQNLSFGMHPTAGLGKDFYDADVFPSLFSTSSASFSREELMLETDIIPPSSFAEWTIELNKEVDNEIVYLSWDNSKWKNNRYQLWLYDEARKQVIDMQESKTYQSQADNSQKIKVLYGTEAELLKYVLPSEIQISQLYPNPVVRDINVTLMVPDQKDGLVNWRLMDVNGRVVKTGIIPLKYGIQNTSFQITERQGLYLLQFTSSEGKMITHQKLFIR